MGLIPQAPRLLPQYTYARKNTNVFVPAPIQPSSSAQEPPAALQKYMELWHNSTTLSRFTNPTQNVTRTAQEQTFFGEFGIPPLKAYLYDIVLKTDARKGIDPGVYILIKRPKGIMAVYCCSKGGGFSPVEHSIPVPYIARELNSELPCVIVQRPFDAMALHWALDGKSNVIAMDREKPDSLLYHYLPETTVYLLSDNRPESEQWYSRMAARFENATRIWWPCGRHIRDFIRFGCDFDLWWNSVLDGTVRKCPVPALSVETCTGIKQARKAFEGISEGTPVAIVPDGKKICLAFENSVLTVTPRSLPVEILQRMSLVTYDAYALRPQLDSLGLTVPAESVMLQAKSLGLDTEAPDELATMLLGYPVEPIKDSARMAQILLRLHGILSTRLANHPNAAWYALLRDAQMVFGNLPGLKVDPDVYAKLVADPDISSQWRKASTQDGIMPVRLKPFTAVSGRFSSTNSAMQSVPTALRKAFITREGKLFIEGDFSQCQSRIVGALSGDSDYNRPFTEGLDLHSCTASQLFGLEVGHDSPLRQVGKQINLMLLYGGGIKALCASVPALSENDARAYLNQFQEKYPQLADWKERMRLDGNRLGYTCTASGRHIPLDATSLSCGWKAVMNIAQGTEVEILLHAALNLDKALKDARLDAQIVHFIHDALLVEVAAEQAETAKQLVNDAMVSAFTEMLPEAPKEGLLKVSVSDNWGGLD